MVKTDDLQKLTRKELAKKIYKIKITFGEPLIPIGSKKRLSEAEFIKRYLNGISGTKGFKKDELISILQRYLQKEGGANARKKK